MFVKHAVFRSLQRIKKSLSQIESAHANGSELIRWQSAAEDVLKEIYKHDNQYVEVLRNARTTALGASNVSLILSEESDDQPTSSALRQRIDTYKETASCLLDAVRDDIQVNGLPFSYASPIKRMWLGLLFSFIGGFATAMLAGWILGYFQSGPAELEKLNQASVLLSDLRSWDAENLAAFKPGWDSIYAVHNGHETSFSGVIVKDLADYAIAYSRRRNHTIDSFLVRLSAFGVDTDTIEIDRRLPIRVGSVIKSFEKRLGLDMGAFGEFYHLDRL